MHVNDRPTDFTLIPTFNCVLFQQKSFGVPRGVVHSQIGCTDFKSSKKSLDFSDFFWIFRIFSDFSDFLDFFRIFRIFWIFFRIFWIFRIFFGFFGFFSDFLDFFRIFLGGVRRLKKKRFSTFEGTEKSEINFAL